MYLDSIGILEHGTPEALALAKKEYWRIWKRNWKKERKKVKKPFTVAYDEAELRTIASMAKKHKRSITRFIQEASLAYCMQEFLIIDPVALTTIRELLSLTYSALQELIDEDKVSPQLGDAVSTRLAKLETEVLAVLYNQKITGV